MLGPVYLRRLIYLILLGGVASGGILPAQGDAEPAPEYGVSGIVTDPQGTPLANATVWVRLEGQKLRHKNRVGEKWIAPVSTTTDEAGRFSVPMAVQGPYRLFMIHPDHPPRRVDEPVDDGSSIEFSFPEPIVYSGYVRDADGEPVAGADVTACGSGAADFGAYACQRTRTGDDGKYTFEKLAKDAHAFQAWAPGYALSAVEVGRFPLAEDGAKTPGALTLEPGAEVSGTLTDDAGTSLAGIRVDYSTDRVRLGQARGTRDVTPLNAIFTDDDGNFSYRGLPAGERLKLLATPAKHRPAESDALTLEAGAVVSGVAIVYRRPASAIVHLIDRDEQPIESVEVLWMPTKDGPRKPRSGFRIAGTAGRTQVEPQGEGHFRITGIQPGRYDVTLLPAGHREIEIEGLRVPAGAEVDLGTHVGRPGATLSGYVFDDLGEPIQGAKLQGLYLRDSTAMSRSAKTEADGRFVLGGLTEGPLLWLKIEAEGHAPKNEQGVDPDQTDYEIVLERVGTLTGRVLLDNGDAPQDVQASLENVAGGIIAFRRGTDTSARGDEEGRFEIKDASPGTYHLRLTAKGARPLRVKDIVVLAGEATDVGTYYLKRGREISGSVRDARDGMPVAKAAISVRAASGGLIGSETSLGTATSDADGRFVVEGLEPGRLIVQIEHADYAPEKVEVIVKEDEPLDEMTVRLGQGGTLRGTVLDESGRPSPNRSIGLTAGGGLLPGDGLVRTNDAGEYRAERIRPGSYRVVLYPDSSGSALNIRQKTATIREAEVTVVDFDNESKIAFEGLLTRGGHPIGEVTVMMIPVDAGGMMQMRTASTDLSGRFEVGLDRPGAYNVMVTDLKQGFGALVGQARIVVPDEPMVSQEIVLHSGTIAGTVFDASGEPIQGSIVSAVREGAGQSNFGAGAGARVDADGSYRIEGINDGTYTLSAVADGYQVATRSIAIVDSSTVDGVDFRLDVAGQLRGRVIDERGNGIPGAFVFALPSGTPDAGGGAPTETDAEGFFRLSAPSAGPCDLDAVARGFAPGGITGFQPSADPEGPGALITLTSGGTITIRVVSAAGTPVDGVQPVVQPQRSSQALTIAMMFSPTLPTDASGSSRVSGLPQGSYRVFIAGQPGVPAQTVTVTDGGETMVTLQLP